MSTTPAPEPLVPPPLPSEYFMCSEAECRERQSSGEISIFESQWPPPPSSKKNDTTNKQPRRVVNPRLAMTKYRRSAAGMDTSNRTPPRTLEQLDCCLSHLEYILCHQQQPPISNNNNTVEFPKQTLTGTVSFVEDRIRAIQVDLVVSQQQTGPAPLQYRMARCHILILYLLGQVPTYETQFGAKALSAALTNYWDDDQTTRGNSTTQNDELLCLMALHQLCQYFLAAGNGGEPQQEQPTSDQTTLSFILDYYRRNVKVQHQCLNNFPHFEWAMKLVDLAVMGRPQSILRQLVELGDTTTNNDSFAILCRCCMAPAIDILRWQALSQYNKSFMKGEKVASHELARLLYFETAEAARTFATHAAGLTLHEDGDHIVFKVAPVAAPKNVLGPERPDFFVFGRKHYDEDWRRNQMQVMRESEPNGHHAPNRAATAWDDLPVATPTNASDKGETEGSTGDCSTFENGRTRVDAEGVLIPPPLLLQRIVQDKLGLKRI